MASALRRLSAIGSFASYVCYSQLHCLWLTVRALVTGEAVTLDVTRPLTDALKVRRQCRDAGSR